MRCDIVNQDALAADPLNPYLYSLLVSKFQSVKIANEGVPAHVTTYPDPLRRGRRVTRADCWGEYYRVCCPYCDDTRHKLWINHRYGADIENGRRTHTHLAVCYKNNCTAHGGRRDQLEAFIFGMGKNFRRAPIKTVVAAYTPVKIEPPGVILPLPSLPEEHPAIQYVMGRGFVPDILSSQFGVGLCDAVSEQKYEIVKNRLYIPITYQGELVGWQARAIHDYAYGPKYFNAPGTSKSRILYNYDAASKQPFVVVVEGVPSVWRLGAYGVCIFGKSMSLYQQTMIAKTWAGKPVFLILDNDAKAEMQQATAVLKQKSVNLVPVFLPDSRDPADYSRYELAAFMSAAAISNGVRCDFGSFCL
jgi:hypothetical protein